MRPRVNLHLRRLVGMTLGAVLVGAAGCRDASTPRTPATPPTPAAVAATATAIESGPPDVSMMQLDPALAGAVATGRSNVLAAPKSADAWGRLGQALDAANFGPEATLCYGRAAALDPGSARWLHLLGLRELREKPDEALRHLAAAAALEGETNDAPRLRLVQALGERGRGAEALVEVGRLLARSPDHAAARLEQARWQLAGGDAAAAVAAVAPCLTNPYTARPANLLLGQAYLRLGDAAAAERHARMGASLPKPFDWPDPYLREVQALRQDRLKLAEVAQGYMQQRRWVDAENTLSNLLARVPGDAEGMLLLGRVQLQQRRCAEAQATLERLLEARPESVNGWMQLGQALYCQSRWEAAAKAFERAVGLKPDLAQGYFNQGQALGRMRDSAGALRCFREALRCNPGDAGTHVALSEELMRGGLADEAERHLERALALEPNHAKAQALRTALPAVRRGRP